jgi:glycosyltransferase involved in cell wall biosynthesis
MKIILTSWSPFIGGAEVAVERLAIGLSAAGHDVLLVVGTEGAALARYRAAGVRCELVPQRFTDKLKWLAYRKSRNQLVEILRREQPDLVHSNDLPSHQMTADAARRLGIPRVCHHRWIFDGPAIDWLNKFDAERHLFVSRALMNDLCGKSEKLAASPCQVVYDGLPLSTAPDYAARNEARVALGLDPARKVALFAGQIIERKGVADILRAWQTLVERAPHAVSEADLIIVGDDVAGEGAYRREMESLAHQLGSPARFVGFQKNVDAWLAAADFVLVPSHAEPLGNATLEAMAAARAVIGTNVGGIPEMIVDGETGLLVAPRDSDALAAAMRRLLDDPARCESLGQHARRRCEEIFSLEAHTEAVLREYDQVLAGRSVVAAR